MKQFKSTATTTKEQDQKIVDIVETMLDEIKQHGEKAVLDYAQKLDGWKGDIILSEGKKHALFKSVPASQKEDILFGHVGH